MAPAHRHRFRLKTASHATYMRLSSYQNKTDRRKKTRCQMLGAGFRNWTMTLTRPSFYGRTSLQLSHVFFSSGCPTRWREIQHCLRRQPMNYNFSLCLVQVTMCFASEAVKSGCLAAVHTAAQASALKPVLRTTGPHLARSWRSSWANAAWVPVVTPNAISASAFCTAGWA